MIMWIYLPLTSFRRERQLLKVGSVSAVAMGRERVERMLVGTEGTAVRVTFRSADNGEVRTIRTFCSCRRQSHAILQ